MRSPIGSPTTADWCTATARPAAKVDRATATMERAGAFVNDVGLLAEEVDASSGELLGNFPQAFSHIGLINAAWALSEAERLESQKALLGKEDSNCDIARQRKSQSVTAARTDSTTASSPASPSHR